MTPLRIAIVQTEDGAGLPLPQYATPGAAGLDLLAACREDVVLQPGERARVPTGMRIAVPPGYEAQVRPRSGLALKHGVTLVNAPGTIDSDYRGPVDLIVINHGDEPYAIQRGHRLAQLVLAPVVRAEWALVLELPDTERGAGGFGHTGR